MKSAPGLVHTGERPRPSPTRGSRGGRASAPAEPPISLLPDKKNRCSPRPAALTSQVYGESDRGDRCPRKHLSHRSDPPTCSDPVHRYGAPCSPQPPGSKWGGGSSPSRLWVSGQGGAHGGRFPAGSLSPAGSAPARWSLGRWGMGYVEDSQALRGQALPAAAMPAGDRGGRYRAAVLRALGSPSPSWQAHQDQGRPPQLPGRPGQGGLL